MILTAIVSSAVFIFRVPSVSKNADSTDKTEKHSARIKTKKHKKAKKTGSTGFTVRQGALFSKKDVSVLLKQYPPNLSCAPDTIRDGKTNLVVHKSIDTVLYKTIHKLLKTYHPKYAAAAAVDPRSGKVLLLAEYTNPDEKPVADELYCRSIFPAASLFKIITASAAIESAGLTPESNIRTCGNNHTLYRFQLEPELRHFREVPLGEAFAYSINPVFARLGIFTLGRDRIAAFISKFGFNEPVPFELETDPSRAQAKDSAYDLAELCSGFNTDTRVSPLYCATMAAAVSHNGTMPVPTLVDSVTDLNSGKKVYSSLPEKWKTPVSNRTSADVRSMMQDVARYGTARKSFSYVKRSPRFDGIEYGGKTGNIELDSIGRIDWFAGFARDPSDTLSGIAIGVVTVHGPYWTVHSSFIGAELIRIYMKNAQFLREKPDDAGITGISMNTEGKK